MTCARAPTLEELLEADGYALGAGPGARRPILRDGAVVAELKAHEVVEWLEEQRKPGTSPHEGNG